MKKLLLAACCLFASSLIAQTTPIPDPAFEMKLIDLGIDTNGMTGDILNSDAEGVNTLNVSASGISSLSGIQAFVDLLILDCDTNSISNLDVSANTALTNLDCQDNTLTTLTLGSNSSLTSIICSNNQLSTVSLAALPALSDFSCQNNQFTSLDLSNNPNLYQLVAHGNQLTSITLHPSPTLLEIFWVYDNQLTNIDLTSAPSLATLRFEDNSLVELDLRNGNNTNINTMDARNNPALELICVDDINYANNATNWNKDSTAEYSETCLLSTGDNFLTEVILSPNPTDGTVSLSGVDRSEIKNLTVWDPLGRKIIESTYNQIDLSAQPAGIYMVRIELSQGTVFMKKLVRK